LPASDGIAMLGAGASSAASGSGALVDGAAQLADGANELGDGIGRLGDGASELGDGLGTAVDQLPSFSDDEATSLAASVRAPVAAASSLSLFGDSAIPLLAAIVLLFGGLATFLALRPVTARALTSRRSSVALALRSFLPGALIGLVQGLLVGGILVWIGAYSTGSSLALMGIAALVGIAFAAIHQALAAVLGGVGRWIAAITGALAVAVSIVSTAPGYLVSMAGVLP